MGPVHLLLPLPIPSAAICLAAVQPLPTAAASVLQQCVFPQHHVTELHTMLLRAILPQPTTSMQSMAASCHAAGAEV
jgi:hypothetical protein